MEKSNKTILAKTDKTLTIVMPVIFCISAGIGISIALSMRGWFYLVGFSLAFLGLSLFVIYLCLPKSAIIYDKEKQIILASGVTGKSIFARFNWTEIPLNQIKDIIGISLDMKHKEYILFNVSTWNSKAGIHIVTYDKTWWVQAVSKPKEAAERIKLLLPLDTQGISNGDIDNSDKQK